MLDWLFSWKDGALSGGIAERQAEYNHAVRQA